MQIPLFKVFMSSSVNDALRATLSSGFIGQGPKVDQFEKDIQNLFNYPYILTVNSATSGLILAIRLIKDNLQLNVALN